MVKKLTKFLQRHWFIILLTLIGAVLRLYRIEATLQFLGDQGRDAIVIRNLLVNQDLPFIGPITSVGGFYLGPLYYYLMAPFLWLSRYNPVGPAIATAFIGIVTIPALYLVAKTMLSLRAAQLAAGLYTFAAIPISATRSAWNPNPMPLAALGIVFGFYMSLTTKKPGWLYLAALSLGSALQLHYMIVFLGPFILYQLILVWRQKKLRQFLPVWLTIILLMMLPLILFEFKNHWLNSKGLIEFLTKNKYSHLSLLQIIKDMRGRSEQVIGMILGFKIYTNFIRTWITRLVLIAIVFLLAKKPKPGMVVISLWVLSGIVTLAVYQSNIYPHYLGFLFPAVFMLAGQLLSSLKGKLMTLSFAFIIIFLIYNLTSVKNIIFQNGNLKSVQTTAEFILKDIEANHYQNYNLVLLDDTRDYKAYGFRYYLEVYGGQPLDIAAYPQTDILYIVSPYRQTDVLSEQIWEINSLKPAQLTQTWEFSTSENIYKIERL